MRSSVLILTMAVTSLVLSPPYVQAQYLRAPTVYAQAAMQQGAPTLEYAVPSRSGYSTYHVGDSGGCDAACNVSDKCGASCDCPACRHGKLLSRSFASVEYLQWWNKGRYLPALVTTSSSGTPINEAGVIGFPDTSILFGDDAIGGELQAAGRLTCGVWLDDCRNVAVGAKVFGVEGHNSGFFDASGGSPILARPFFDDDPLVNAADSLLVAFPGFTQGFVDVRSESEVFGGEAFLRYAVDAGCNYRLDVVSGYHYTRINDDLLITTSLDDGSGVFDYLDLFDTSNEFHAGGLGLLGEWYLCRWTLAALGKVSFGNMRQRVAISGQNTITAGGSVTTPGGLLTQPTNIGVYTRDVAVWAPEASFKLSYAFTKRLSVSVGYTFLYWNRVALAGDQVDRTAVQPRVNATQLNGGTLQGPATPAFSFRDTDFWVQTVDIGVNWNY